MNLYRLELKRVCKTRMTAILLAIALVLAVVTAYLPVTFIGWTELDVNGNKVSYTGLKAIRKRQEQQVSGTITPDVMQEALEAYQRVYRQYDASSINDIPVRSPPTAPMNRSRGNTHGSSLTVCVPTKP